jgi:hypothetical protein
VIDIETALLQQLLNIAQRKRIAKIPPDCTKYEAGFGLPPFEDRGSGSHFAILSRHQPATSKVATHPDQRPYIRLVIDGESGPVFRAIVLFRREVIASNTMSSFSMNPSVASCAQCD